MTTAEHNIAAQLSWQKALTEAISCPQTLLQHLELPTTTLNAIKQGHALFPLRVPMSFVHRMRKNAPDDPLLNQVLPLAAEAVITPDYHVDPLRETQHNPLPGLLHKYQGRVLLLLSGGCAVHCRYCFRRHFPYQQNNPGQKGWRKILAYIAQDASIKEVILSGGDPLILPDDRLHAMIQELNDIPHLQLLRIHSRLPIMIPQRITLDLVALLRSIRLTSVMVIHCNHSQEINDEVIHALAPLHQQGITLLNQSVLLRGINDTPDTLADLSYKLIAAKVLPYYLHMPDQVQGTAHFTVSEEKAKQIMAILSHRLPGYLLPKLVREVAGQPSKTPLR